MLVLGEERLQGFEFKFSAKPAMTKSLYYALSDLDVANVTVIVPGTDTYPIHEKVQVCGLKIFCEHQKEKILNGHMSH